MRYDVTFQIDGYIYIHYVYITIDEKAIDDIANSKLNDGEVLMKLELHEYIIIHQYNS